MVNMTALAIIHQIVAPATFGLIVLFGIFGNLLVIIVVAINKQLRNCTNILIVSLAVADITFIIFCVPLTATIFIKVGWIFGNLICKIYQYLSYLTAYMSVYTLVLMSIDRYLAVVHPISSMVLRTERNAVKIVISTWIIFMTVNTPMFFNSGIAYAPPQINVTRNYFCTYLPTLDYNSTSDGYVEKNHGKTYILVFFIFGYLLPLSSIILLYAILIWKLLFKNSSHISQSNKALKSKKRVTRMVVVVVVTFALCWLPIQTVFIIQLLEMESEHPAFRAFHVLGNALAYSNSMMNPILYAFFSNNFRQAFKNLLFCQQQNYFGRDFEKTNLNINKHIAEERSIKKKPEQHNLHPTTILTD